jgi:hypothetical protein
MEEYREKKNKRENNFNCGQKEQKWGIKGRIYG